MLELRTFGGLSIRDGGAPITGAATQRKTLALLALLAAASKNGLSRDKLIAYLWPETDTEHGRNLLNQACYALRRDLHAPALFLGATELRLNPDVIRSDLQLFEDALARGDPERAVTAYGGPFLDGFFLTQAGEFERWLDAERAQLAKQYSDALATLAKEAAARGDHRRAADWWRRLTSLDPLSSHAALGLMTALVAAGESAEAIKHARVHEAFVQQEIGTVPDGAVLALVQQLCQEAERGASSLGVSAQLRRRQSTTDFLLAALPAVLRREIRRATTLSTVAAAFGIVIVVGAVGYAVSGRRGTTTGLKPPPVADRKMLAVLPFENLGPPDDEYFADGLTEVIATRLSGIRELGVIARQSAIQYKKTTKTPREIAAELGVQYILAGTVRWESAPGTPSRIRVSPTLIRVVDGTELWAEQYDTVLGGVFAVQSALAERVVRALDITVTERERQALVARPTDNLPAYEAYMRGWDARARGFDPADLKRAAEMFERATTLDPGFASAYAELTLVDLLLYNNYVDRTEARLSGARAALARALRLDPNLPEGRLALGWYYAWHLHDWAHARAEFQRIQRLQPNYGRVVEPLADVARRQGHWKESLAYYRTALELNPRSAILPASIGDVYIALRRYPEALAVYDRGLEIAPQSVDLRFTKAMIYLSQTGDLSASRRLLPDVSENIAPTGVELLVTTLADVVPLLDDAQQAEVLELGPAALDGDTAGLALAKAMVYRTRGQEVAARVYFDSARVALEASLGRREDEYGRLTCMLGIALAGLGRNDDALREGKRAVETLSVSKDAMEGPLMLANLARIYVMLGEWDKAVDQLETVLARPGPLSAGWLRADPFWDPLRESPRFQRLAAARN